MCGIVGAAGNLTKKNEDVFKTLLRLDTLRGPHSTGVLSVTPNGDTNVKKCLGTPWEFFDSKSCEDIFRSYSNVLVGHNRYATKGKITKNNAHPFVFDNIIGVHNGTIRGQHRLPDYKNFDVDSENIFYSMEMEGEKETLENLDGAYALVWWNVQDRVLRIARNDERPMYYVFTADHSTMFFASEEWMLHVACGRNDVKVGEVLEAEPEYIYDFNVPLQSTGGKEEFGLPKLTRFYEYIRPATQTTYYGGGGYSTGVRGNTTKSTQKSNVTPLPKSGVPIKGDVVEFMVTGEQDGHGNGPYISGQYVEDNTQIRVHFPKNGKSWNEMLNDDGGFFHGKISSVKWQNNTKYFVIDINSIMSSDAAPGNSKEETDSNMYPIFQAKADVQTWERQVVNGCCMCGDVATRAKAHEYRWLAHKTFACEKCKDLEIVNEYANATN